MRISSVGFEGVGMTRVYENAKWMVGIKNWKPENDVLGVDCLERHNQTDESFVLLAGACVLLYAAEREGGGLDIMAERMEPMRLYTIPASMWHTTVTVKGTKLVLIEDSATSSGNSDILKLDERQVAEVREIARP